MNSADNIQAIYSLSPLQEGMLFHTVADPASGVYVEQSSFKLGGDIDIVQFRAAWQALINRHAVLRTSFVWRGLERMAQVVFRDTEAPLRTADWRALDASEQETALRAYLEADRREGFDLSKAPLLRLFLVRLNEAEHQFLISYHHALLDGWSYMMLLKEMAHTYEALVSATELRLPEPRQYRDFIRWLEKQDTARAEAFWRTRLVGFARPTPLPLAQTTRGAHAAAVESFTDAEINVVLPRELTASLNEFAKRVRVSLNSLVQSAWSLVLSRASGEEDVVFGATVAGRPAELEGVEYMVGLFINTIPVRARIDDGARLTDWLRSFQAERAADYEFQHTRLVDIQKFSALEQGRGLFDSLLVFENYPTDVFERRRQQQGGVEEANGARRALDIQQSTTHELVNYPLCLVACPGEELRLVVAYSSARFTRAAAEQIGRWLTHVLGSFVERPHARLRDIGLVQPGEEEAIRRLAQGDYATRDAADTAHKLFERHARAQAVHAAVVAGQLSISYGELNAWANRLARHLRRKARVGSEARVGIFLERGADMIAAVLAVLKAGATYVPLDPGYPAERLAYITEDCALESLITTSDIAALAPHVAKERLIELDTDAAEIERHDASDLETDIHTESLAYVIYTSGSTGKPKGTAVSHAALAAHCRGWADFCALTPRDRVLQFASLSFDASVEQIFPTLAAGATLVVRERQPWSTLEFARNAVNYGLTVVDLPAAFFAECTRNWQQLAPHIADSPLRLVAAGGDRVSAEGAALWREALPSVRLVNAYGPTEATVTATGGDIDVDAQSADNVPIGRPLDNRTVYVLDARMRLAPFDVAGELYLGGEALARGYWNRPAQTALSFVPDPFSHAPGARLYRTGDRARLGRDGALEFLGRADDQLKIRGYRVEPREVELACEEHASVARCLALPYEGTAGRELAAYVVARSEHALDEEDLRAHLARRLPRFSIPQSIIFLEAFPMLPNDRIDRQRLPAPDAASALEGRGARIAPRNAYEEMLAELWADVLSCEQPGVTDDFFLTGGHSLDATRLASRVYDTFGVELPLRTIFEQPTVAELAATIAELQSASLAQEDAQFLDELEAIS